MPPTAYSDGMGEPIAIVVAKRTSKGPIIGRKQAEEYGMTSKPRQERAIYQTS